MKQEGIMGSGPSVKQSKAETLDIGICPTSIIFGMPLMLAQPGYFVAISKHLELSISRL
jgi:hypothetical protein